MAHKQQSAALSSRIRFARKLTEFPFPTRMTEKQRVSLREKVRAAFFSANANMGREYEYIDVDGLPEIQVQAMAEEHLISPEFARGPKGRGLIVNKSKNVSIMINEEDHLRIQVLQKGFDLDSAYTTAKQLDRLLGEKLGYAYSEEWGYLTSCHTNVGTGMRASVMLHLPAITALRAVEKLVSETNRLGVTVRGVYGEGSQAEGDLYQLSNRITLGVNERETLDRLKEVIQSVISEEERLLKYWYDANPVAFEDKIQRAWATLQSARLMSGAEFLKFYSLCRTGIVLGLLSGSLDTLDNLFAQTRPASIAAREGKALEPVERDAIRANMCREALCKR